MKRVNNLFEKIFDLDNLYKAHINAKKGKSKYTQIKNFEEKLDINILKLYNSIKNKTYNISEYIVKKRIEKNKEREIFILPYKDRVIHHALLQIIMPILEKSYIKDTYQSIKNRGVHKAKKRLDYFFKTNKDLNYCLKIDIKKFYPNVNNDILKQLIRKKIKCKDTLWLIDKIIDSTNGLPIGNYTSQTFGNFYLSYFDHYVKEKLKVKYYIRYCDDIIFLSNKKQYLHFYFNQIKKYLNLKLQLTIKNNYQIFDIQKKGIDFLGFRFFKKYTLLRKSIKVSYIKVLNNFSINSNKNKLNSIMSYYGWIIKCNCYNFQKKYFNKNFILSLDIFCKKHNIKNPLKAIKII